MGYMEVGRGEIGVGMADDCAALWHPRDESCPNSGNTRN